MRHWHKAKACIFVVSSCKVLSDLDSSIKFYLIVMTDVESVDTVRLTVDLDPGVLITHYIVCVITARVAYPV